jgi:hypothetical protein
VTGAGTVGKAAPTPTVVLATSLSDALRSVSLWFASWAPRLLSSTVKRSFANRASDGGLTGRRLLMAVAASVTLKADVASVVVGVAEAVPSALNQSMNGARIRNSAATP